jgi:hypothetical protein
MFGRRGFGIIWMVLLIIGLLALGGYAGWSQGYMMGLAASSGEGARVVPHPPFGYGYGYGFFPLFFGLGIFFKLAFILLFFLFIGKVFRFWAWRTAGGPPGEHWARHYGHTPPWYSEEKGTPERPKGEADVDDPLSEA